MPDIIGSEQGAFVKGRGITDNTMMAHELIQYYERKWLTLRVCIKVDIRKAFDSISWTFLKDALNYFGFPTKFSNWIIACIFTPTFSVLVNGTPHGFFPDKRGLRQGDPLPPPLFVLCMEILSHILRAFPYNAQFGYHLKYHHTHLTHLTFADDLLVFMRGDLESVFTVKYALDTFAHWSGLHAYPLNTAIYLGWVDSATTTRILAATGYSKESFPFRYLICTSQLTFRNRTSLLDIIRVKGSYWTIMLLSYAGKLQLINSVIFGMINF